MIQVIGLCVWNVILWALTRHDRFKNVTRIVVGVTNVIVIGSCTAMFMRYNTGNQKSLEYSGNGQLILIAIFIFGFYLTVQVSGRLIGEGLTGKRFKAFDILSV
jgi:hypothetical protein